MKKFLFIPALIISALITSCNIGDEENYSEFFTYATVFAAADQDSGIAFVNDYDQTFYVISNATNTDLSTLTVGDRKVISVKAVASELSDYDFAITLNNIYDVEVGECVTVETQEESDALLDSPFEFISPDIVLTQGFLSIYVGYPSDDIMNIKYYLVDNKVAELEEEIEDGYVYLELRIATTNVDDGGKDYEEFVSFDLEPFRDILEGKDGIILRLNTETNDIVYHEISSSSIFAE